MTKVLVRGPALTRSGYGEHVRFVLRSLRQLESDIDLYVIPVGWGQTGWVIDNNEERDWLDALIKKTTVAVREKQTQFDVSIQVTIPNEWEKLAPVNIGVTAGIETTKISPQWVEKSNMMDLVIVPSEHSKDIMVDTTHHITVTKTDQVIDNYRCTTPVEVVSYPVKKFKDLDLDLKLNTDFNFLAVAQWGPRKNIVNCIQWFIEEFIDQEVGLVLKTNLTKNSLLDRKKITNILKNVLAKEDYKNRKCKIYLLHGDMTDQEIHQLYRNPKIKAFLTTTHGEGFGLPLFEAAYEGMPIIAPNWSGHVDFLHMPIKNKKGKVKNKAMFSKVDHKLQLIQKEAVWDGVIQADSMWCYPDQGSFKIKMREIYKDYGRFKKQAIDLQKYLLDNLTADQQYEKMNSLFLPYMASDLKISDTNNLMTQKEVEDWINDLDEITEV